MSSTLRSIVVINVALASSLLGGSVLGQVGRNYCRDDPRRSDALDFPSRHAWNLFIKLNHPALTPDVLRGEPDCDKPVGTPATTVVWETWRLARTEVFLADGSEPPHWNDRSLPGGDMGRVPEPLGLLFGETMSFHGQRFTDQPLFDLEDGVFVDRGGIGETRMNQSTFEFIKKNCLWSSDGLQRYVRAVIDGKKPALVFPPDSVEVKAVWLEFTEDDIQANRHARYYLASADGKTYGLTSFHILTKDVPNWFWATFHHVDAPDNRFEVPDTYGRPAELHGTVWENYVLGGTQIDFISPIGQPTILSDHYIEFGFQRSSCITCHAQANGSPDGSLGPVQTINVGPPDPDPFLKNGKPFYIQTDFLWSIPFRARSETGEPPQRCAW